MQESWFCFFNVVSLDLPYVTLYNLSISFLSSRKYGYLALRMQDLSWGGQIIDFLALFTRKREKLHPKVLVLLLLKQKDGKKSWLPIYDDAQGLKTACSCIHEQREQSCALPWAPEDLNPHSLLPMREHCPATRQDVLCRVFSLGLCYCFISTN